MAQTRGYSILIVAMLLFGGFVVSLQSQQPGARGGSSATAVDIGELLAMTQEERFEALQGMERAQRLAALRQLPREERRTFREWGRSTVQPSQRSGATYQPLPQAQALDESPANEDAGIWGVAGTSIQYDSGVVTGFVTLAASSRSAVNRFDIALNTANTATVPIEQSGTITGLTFHLIRTSVNIAYWSLYDNVMGTTARFLTDAQISVATGLNTHTVDTMVTANNRYQGGSFLAGIFQFNTMYTRVGADTNSNGLGFHGASINDASTPTGFNTLGNVNFVVRVRGNIVTPIELMNFEIE